MNVICVDYRCVFDRAYDRITGREGASEGLIYREALETIRESVLASSPDRVVVLTDVDLPGYFESLLESLGIFVVNYHSQNEIIAYLSLLKRKVIVTDRQRLFHLIDEDTKVFDPFMMEWITKESFKLDYGFSPIKFPLYQSLVHININHRIAKRIVRSCTTPEDAYSYADGHENEEIRKLSMLYSHFMDFWRENFDVDREEQKKRMDGLLGIINKKECNPEAFIEEVVKRGIFPDTDELRDWVQTFQTLGEKQ